MGAALEHLGAAACRRIAGELLTLTGRTGGPDCLGAHCPWHQEQTPGAFWYYADKDYARCYSCGRDGDLLDVFCAVEGLPERSAASFTAFFERFAPDALKNGKSRARRPAVPRRDAWRPRERMQIGRAHV